MTFLSLHHLLGRFTGFYTGYHKPYNARGSKRMGLRKGVQYWQVSCWGLDKFEWTVDLPPCCNLYVDFMSSKDG
jgi:hypothetical protein